MKITIKQLLLPLLSFVLISSAMAKTNAEATTTVALPTPTVAATPTLTPAPPELNAKGYVLLDANSGHIIAEKNASTHMPPASLTKLMTLYIIADSIHNNQINLDDKVKISNKAWHMGGSRMFVRAGSKVPIKDLIQGIIVASGNDATFAMAQYIGGTEPAFVSMMNQTAASLGMNNTHYSDSNGLPTKNHYSSPEDLAILARAWILNFPEYYPWFKQKWITYNKIKQPNRNRLLWRDPSVDGLKTGHTDAAGYCLIASAERNGMRLISVVMGTPTDSSRADDSEALLNYGFRFYESHKLYDANTPLTTPRIWFGKTEKIGFGLTKPLYITIPKGQYKKVKATISLSNTLKAPIKKGQSYGSVKITLSGKPIASEPLVALQDDPEAGFWSRSIDHVSLLFHSWF
ncbi:MAG: D-alanyl-D-alanine carboxypeptidase [Gammaproteobacteria bacterium]|nr:D-alanyl-D-alanine carboxypeptidase [Gammaproteobacteria bacterium]